MQEVETLVVRTMLETFHLSLSLLPGPLVSDHAVRSVEIGIHTICLQLQPVIISPLSAAMLAPSCSKTLRSAHFELHPHLYTLSPIYQRPRGRGEDNDLPLSVVLA